MKKLFVERTTLSTRAYVALRAAILSRRLAPGKKLVVRTLVDQLGLSPTPIKLALAALSREGLVVAIPHRGFFVPRITGKDIEDIYALREMVDGLAARLAAERSTAESIKNIMRLLRSQQKYVESGNSERYGDLDLAFHRTIRKASGNSRLIAVAEAFDGQIRLLISTSAKVPGRLHVSLREHTAVAEAIIRKDPAGAEETMRHHVRQAGIALSAYMKDNSIAPQGSGQAAI